MPVVAFVNQKGGCSKSTTAVHFVWWLARKQGRSVLLVDADAQCSSSKWVAHLEQPLPFKVLSDPDALLDGLPGLAQEYEYVVVDGPGGLAETSRAVVLCCDLAVIPCLPTGLDLSSASEAMRVIKQAQRVRGGLPTAVVFLSKAVRGTRLKAEARKLLEGIAGMIVLQEVVHLKQVIADAYGQGATVWEMPGRAASESALEYRDLFNEILKVLSS